MKAKLISTLWEYQDKLGKGKIVWIIKKYYINTFIQLVLHIETTDRHRQNASGGADMRKSKNCLQSYFDEAKISTF